MSIEFVILLALFTLLPILEQAWRKWKEERQRAERRSKGLPPTLPTPPPIPRRPPMQQVPPGQEPVLTRPEAEEHDDRRHVPPTAPERPRVPAADRPPVPAPLRRVAKAIRQTRPVRPLIVVEGPASTVRARRRPSVLLRGRSNLRRGFVLMTVLGPCRANVPHRGPGTGD